MNVEDGSSFSIWVSVVWVVSVVSLRIAHIVIVTTNLGHQMAVRNSNNLGILGGYIYASWVDLFARCVFQPG